MALSKLAEPSPKTTYASFLFYVIHTHVQLQSVVGLQFIILYKGREGGIGSEIKACNYDVALLFVLSLFFFFTLFVHVSPGRTCARRVVLVVMMMI